MRCTVSGCINSVRYIAAVMIQSNVDGGGGDDDASSVLLTSLTGEGTDL